MAGCKLSIFLSDYNRLFSGHLKHFEQVELHFHLLARADGNAEHAVEPVRLRCDRGGFQTIASNLLSNAVRYTPENGHVSVRLTTDGNAIVLQIEDTGVGISQEDLARIFERFYRADKHRSSDTGGTGLGLSIVKHLTNALGGTITVRSALHKGSCFEVRLPGLKTE